jgi:hypothetical protein
MNPGRPALDESAVPIAGTLHGKLLTCEGASGMRS